MMTDYARKQSCVKYDAGYGLEIENEWNFFGRSWHDSLYLSRYIYFCFVVNFDDDDMGK